MDMAQHMNLKKITMRIPVGKLEPLVGLHPGNPSQVVGNKIEEEEYDMRVEGEVEEEAVGNMQESEAPQQRKIIRVATPYTKLLHVFTVDDARDMYSNDATATFKEMKMLKRKKIYGNYAIEGTIAISNDDEDNMELAKWLRSDFLSPTAFTDMVMLRIFP